MRLFLCGDVMTGRGIDQILRHAVDPTLCEGYIRSAREYVALAERASGPIPGNAPPDYVWGDALAEIDRRAPDLRIVNLETSVTARGAPEGKAVNYRMHPANLDCLTAARIDACVLANNHVEDWGPEGLLDTLEALQGAGLPHPGAGVCEAAARRGAALESPAGRVRLFAYGLPSSGVPGRWGAVADRAGVNWLGDAGEGALRRVAADVREQGEAADVVVVSLHWGPNWGYEVPAVHRRFAAALVEECGVHVVHGHSSHHPLGIEVRDGRPILYGCGDFINDYEGIGGHEEYRGELVLGYALDLDGPGRRLSGLEMLPFRLRRFRLERVGAEDLEWLRARMDRECGVFGRGVAATAEGTLRLVL